MLLDLLENSYRLRGYGIVVSSKRRLELGSIVHAKDRSQLTVRVPFNYGILVRTPERLAWNKGLTSSFCHLLTCEWDFLLFG